ncbi:hypothetical protein [Bacillus phage BC-T25]|nr:hypothetical protein [Bacillus phage BC-T25]
MSTEGYLTPEDFDIAEKNGIHRVLAHNRFYHNGFSKERAITQRVKNHGTEWVKWKDVAESNGICWATFNTRIECDYEPERAATEKPMTKLEVAAHMRKLKEKNRRISDELIQRAKKNGISYNTLAYRLLKSKHKWSEEDAVTIPPLNNKERAKHANAHSPFRRTNHTFFI